MSDLKRETIVRAVHLLLKESFEGLPPDSSTWYSDSGPEGALLPLLGSISAGVANRPPREGGRTIAQHARHERFHLEVTERFLGGDRSGSDWNRSWDVDARDDAAWQREVSAMKQAYEAVRARFERVEWNEETLASALGTVAHAAYHMGAIRQILAQVRN